MNESRIDPEGPLAQAQWAKTRYGIATQTLPNGYCGLPLQTDLPARQRLPDLPGFPDRTRVPARASGTAARTLTLIDVSERGGQARMVEMNQQVLTNLDRMIGEVERPASGEVPLRMRADNSHSHRCGPPPSYGHPASRAMSHCVGWTMPGLPITFDTVAREARGLPVLALQPARPARRDRTTPCPDDTRPTRQRLPTGNAHPSTRCAGG